LSHCARCVCWPPEAKSQDSDVFVALACSLLNSRCPFSRQIIVVNLTWAVRRPSSPPPTVRVLCVPYAGGTSAIFRGWSHALPSAAVGFVELPNRLPGGSSTAIGIDGVASALADIISSTCDDLPCVVFGHSLGALIAFETARRLADWPPLAGLIVSGRRPPALPPVHPAITGLPDADFLAAIQDRYKAIPAAVLQEPELLALLLPRLRADMVMLETYRYEAAARLPCPLLVYGGDADPHAPAPQLPGWADEAGGRCEVRLFAGGHFYFQEAPAPLLDVLATDLAICVREAVRLSGCN
jgi:medium-chain acyl-[acyl-carrier-protein] hydrolase